MHPFTVTVINLTISYILNISNKFDYLIYIKYYDSQIMVLGTTVTLAIFNKNNKYIHDKISLCDQFDRRLAPSLIYRLKLTCKSKYIYNKTISTLINLSRYVEIIPHLRSLSSTFINLQSFCIHVWICLSFQLILIPPFYMYTLSQIHGLPLLSMYCAIYLICWFSEKVLKHSYYSIKAP